MLSGFKSLFTSGSLATDADPGVLLVTGALLLEMAGKDEDYAPEEVQAIFGVLKKQFKLKDQEVMDLLEAADKLREESADHKDRIGEFVAAINNRLNEQQRIKVLAMIWKVVMADEMVDDFERKFAAQMKSRLQLTDDQADEAQRLARMKLI